MKAVSKYVIFKDRQGVEHVETFSTSIIHAEQVRRMGIKRTAIVSAGFVSDKQECFGASSSLHKSSRPRQDTELLRDESGV